MHKKKIKPKGLRPPIFYMWIVGKKDGRANMVIRDEERGWTSSFILSLQIKSQG